MATRRRLSLSVVLLLITTAILLLPRGQRATTPLDATQQKLWSVYWTVRPGFTSTLEMKNNRVDQTLNVTPTLYFRSGEEYPLAAVALAPRQTVVLSLNAALASLPADPKRDRSEGTLEVGFTASNDQALMGNTSVTNPDQGIAWNFRLYASESGQPSVPVRGPFWLPDDNTKALVAMQNTSVDFITVSPIADVAGRSYPLPSTRLAPDQGYTLNLGEALRAAGLTDVRAGGIELTYEGPGDALKAHEVLFNGQGFSTEVDLLQYQSMGDIPHTIALRTPQFAIGPADPLLGLRLGTRFDPTLVLHNFDIAALQVTLFVGFRNGNTATEKHLPIALAGGETKIVALYPLLTNVLPPEAHWASLEIQYSNRQNALAAALVSTSQDGAHSIRSVLNWVEGSASDGPFWQVDEARDTLVAMFNADTQPAEVDFSLDYYVGSERHQHKLTPLMIPPRSAQQVDVGAVLSSREPDSTGDIIPQGVTFGGYRVEKVGPRIDQALLTQSLVLDRTAKSYLTFYNTCCGYIAVEFSSSPSPLTGAVGGTGQLTITALAQCTSSWRDVTLSGTFSSDNTNVASVNSSGLVSYKAPGQTTVHSHLNYYTKKRICFPQSAGSSTSVTVQVPTSLKFVSVTVLPDGPAPPSGCPPSANYGIMIDIKYQVLDQNATTIQSANMTPHENGILFTGGNFDIDIGPVTGFPTSSKNTASDGTFHDVPFGRCSSVPINTPLTATQNITIITPDGTPHPVRSQTWTLSAVGIASFGHGTIKNNITSPGSGSDVSASR